LNLKANFSSTLARWHAPVWLENSAPTFPLAILEALFPSSFFISVGWGRGYFSAFKLDSIFFFPTGSSQLCIHRRLGTIFPFPSFFFSRLFPGPVISSSCRHGFTFSQFTSLSRESIDPIQGLSLSSSQLSLQSFRMQDASPHNSLNAPPIPCLLSHSFRGCAPLEPLPRGMFDECFSSPNLPDPSKTAPHVFGFVFLSDTFTT